MPGTLVGAGALEGVVSLAVVIAGVLSEVLSLVVSLSVLLLSGAALLDDTLWKTDAAVGTASVEPHAAKVSAALTIAAAMVNFFFIVDSSSFRFSVYERQEVPRSVLPWGIAWLSVRIA